MENEGCGTIKRNRRTATRGEDDGGDGARNDLGRAAADGRRASDADRSRESASSVVADGAEAGRFLPLAVPGQVNTPERKSTNAADAAAAVALADAAAMVGCASPLPTPLSFQSLHERSVPDVDIL